ncbi:hypothetical protein Prudu_006584 [Prunus dulcis]|uniref:Uncharacterized protein n=1 Tax=Prunus dulcis TaxID=3755 RepID=A0A4Y1R030_PRUDU|nr:hypothetical protein Prudu_006584 [Prunus dulcis]
MDVLFGGEPANEATGISAVVTSLSLSPLLL